MTKENGMNLTNRKIEVLNHIENLRLKLDTLDVDMFSQNEQAHNISQAIVYLMGELCEISAIELELNTKKVA